MFRQIIIVEAEEKQFWGNRWPYSTGRTARIWSELIVYYMFGHKILLSQYAMQMGTLRNSINNRRLRTDYRQLQTAAHCQLFTACGKQKTILLNASKHSAVSRISTCALSGYFRGFLVNVTLTVSSSKHDSKQWKTSNRLSFPYDSVLYVYCRTKSSHIWCPT